MVNVFRQPGSNVLEDVLEGGDLLEPKVLQVGDRVRVVRKVLSEADIERINRFVSRETGEERYLYSPVDISTDEVGIGVVHITAYPHPWAGHLTGSWVSSMDRTIGLEGSVFQVLNSRSPEVISAGGRIDCNVQVRVDYPDGTYRLWWYSRLAIAYIPEEEMNLQSNDVEAPELRLVSGPATAECTVVGVNIPTLQEVVSGRVTSHETTVYFGPQEGTPVRWVPDLSPGMAPSIHTPSPAIPVIRIQPGVIQETVPELRPGLAQETVPELRQGLVQESVSIIPELRPGLVQESVSVIPELRPGLATASTATTTPLVEGHERPVFYEGDEVEVVRAVYSREQRSIYEADTRYHDYVFPANPVFDDAWEDVWTNEMNSLIGHRGTVTEVHRVRGPIIEFEGDYLDSFSMSPFSLRLIRRGGVVVEQANETLQPDTAQAMPEVPTLRPGTVPPSSAPIFTGYQPCTISVVDVSSITGSGVVDPSCTSFLEASRQKSAPTSEADPFRNARLGMIIGGGNDSEEYFVLGFASVNELMAGGEELGRKIIGRHFDDGRLEYSPYLKRLISLVTGIHYQAVPPVISYAQGETSRSTSALRTLYVGFAYQQQDQVPDEDGIVEESPPSYWLAVVELSTNSDGVVTSGAIISDINERVYI